MKRILFLFFIICTSAIFVIYFGCSSTKTSVPGGEETNEDEAVRNDYQEIERLLGITRGEPSPTQTQQQTKSSSQNKNNNDLLQLLTVDEGKRESKTITKESNASEKNVATLEDQLEQEKKDIQKINTQIADLKTQLLQKDIEKNKSSNSNSSTMLNTKIPSDYPSLATVNITPSENQYATQSYKNEYDKGLSLFHKRQYRSALTVFEQLLAIDTHNDFSDNAQYWMGESYYAMGMYPEAIMAFEKVFTFRYSNKNDYAQFMIAQCYYMSGNKTRARHEFQVFLDNYPNSDLVSRANSYLTRL